MKKVIVVLSGGLDSCVLLFEVLDKYGPENVTALSFNYGAKHNRRELRSAKHIAELCEVERKVIDLPFIGELFNSSLLQKSVPIPKGPYTDEALSQTIVPFRNGIMLSIAAGYAESSGAQTVYYGAHHDDGAVYPDCTSYFVESMTHAIYKGTLNNVMLIASFVNCTKSQIVTTGHILGVPFESTYSCYEGGPVHCGECSTCFARKNAFSEARLFDPTEYLK